MHEPVQVSVQIQVKAGHPGDVESGFVDLDIVIGSEVTRTLPVPKAIRTRRLCQFLPSSGRLIASPKMDWSPRSRSSNPGSRIPVPEKADPARMTRHLTYVYDRIRSGAVSRTVFETELRYSTQAEIESLLQEAGLRVTHVYGDYDLSPVGAGTENLVFVARAEKAS